MKILLYSDLHVEAERVDINKAIETLKLINKIKEERNIDYVANLGDTLDFSNHTKSKMKITPSLMNLIYKIGVHMKDHIIIRGNHEYHEEGDLINIFELFKAKTVTSPIEMTVGGKSLLFMPYYDSLGVSKLEYKFKDTYDYVFGHFEISGSLFESGMRDTGEDSSILSLFKWKQMIIGHYHIRQKIRSNIYSIGACQSRVRCDNETKMGFTILDLDTGGLEFIENPYAEYQLTENNRVTEFRNIKSNSNLDLELELQNFKLEKKGIDVILDYVKTKSGVYDKGIIEYTIEYLEGLKRND